MKDFDISLLEGSSVKIKNLIVQVICKEKGMVVSFNSKYEKPGLD
jgi:hypothetical protein